jgi:hypothetical protein
MEVSKDRLKLTAAKREEFDKRFNQALIDDEMYRVLLFQRGTR